jgi:hypothetical protein
MPPIPVRNVSAARVALATPTAWAEYVRLAMPQKTNPSADVATTLDIKAYALRCNGTATWARSRVARELTFEP